MKKYTQKDIKNLFSNLCCSRCKNDFSINSITETEKDGDLLLCELKCTKCDKEYGKIIFNFNRKTNTHNPLEIMDGPAPITIDDVIDAHKFIKKMK